MDCWHKLKRPIMVLAPMADVTDPVFRYIIAKYSKYGGQDIGMYGKFTRPPLGVVGGPDAMWTEFVSADGLFLGGYDALIKDLAFTDAERPIVAQFFTGKPEMMEKAAELAVDLGFDGIDINMGCPDKSIEKQGSGSAHIKDYKNAQEIILSAKKGAQKNGKNLPVSVKTRIGYNKDELETWLPALLETNPAVITLHARTRKEMSLVPARWENIKRAVEIRNNFVDSKGNRSDTLIFGNGDVKDLADAEEKVKETGCDGVMLGRAIFGNPFLFSNSRATKISSSERGRDLKYSCGEWTNRVDVEVRKKTLRVMVEHTKLFEELLPHKSFSIMKKHYKAYVNGWPARNATHSVAGGDGAKELRMKLMEAKDASEVAGIVENYLKTLDLFFI